MVVSYVVVLVVPLRLTHVTRSGPGRWMPPLVFQLPRLGVAAPGGELASRLAPAPPPSAWGERGVVWHPPGPRQLERMLIPAAGLVLQARRPWQGCGAAPTLPDREGHCGPQSFGLRGQPLPSQQLAGVGVPSLCWFARLEGVP